MSVKELLSVVLARYAASPTDADARRLADEVPGLLDACKTVLPYIENCGFGGNNRKSEGRCIRDLKRVIAKFEAEGK